MASLGHSTITVTMNTYERVLPAIMNCVLNTLMSPQMTLHLLAVM